MRVNSLMLALTLAVTMVSAAQAQRSSHKPTIAVLEFKNESGAGWWSGGVGWELSGMLANELVATRGFSVLERNKIQAVLEEQNLGASGRVQAGTAARMGKIIGAEYLIDGTVTAYEENTSNTGGGITVKGISLGGNSSSAYLAIDLRVINATTGAVEYVRTIEGTSKGGGMSIGISRGGFGGALGSQKKTPAGKAIRAALVEATDYLKCAMVDQTSRCLASYDAKDDRRRDSSRGALKLD